MREAHHQSAPPWPHQIQMKQIQMNWPISGYLNPGDQPQRGLPHSTVPTQSYNYHPPQVPVVTPAPWMPGSYSPVHFPGSHHPNAPTSSESTPAALNVPYRPHVDPYRTHLGPNVETTCLRETLQTHEPRPTADSMPPPSKNPDRSKSIRHEAGLVRMKQERESIFQKAAEELAHVKRDAPSTVASIKAWEDAWAVLRENMNKM